MAEAPDHVPWKTARKRSRQKKERVEMRNFGQILIKNQQEIQEELSDLRDSGAEAGSVKSLSIWLENSLTMRLTRPPVCSEASEHFQVFKFLKENLTFKKVKDVGINPFLQLPSAEGTRISKKMSYFLRHNLPHGRYSGQDGSMPISDRGGHTGLFLEIPYETPESGGLLNVEKDRKKIGYPSLKEK